MGTCRAVLLSHDFEQEELGEIEMIGRLVEKQSVGFGDPRPGDQGKPLPSPAECPHGLPAHRRGRLELVERDVGPPVLPVALRCAAAHP